MSHPQLILVGDHCRLGRGEVILVGGDHWAGPVVGWREAAQAGQHLCEGLVVLGVHHPQGPRRLPLQRLQRGLPAERPPGR